jgi:ABC-type transport system substrate-binding protein
VKTKLFYAISMLIVVALLAGCGATPTTAPVQPTAAPVEPTAAPVEPTAAPVEPTAAPVEPTAAPVEPTAAAPALAPEVVEAIGADPSDLSPFVGMSMGRIAVLKTIYEYLVETDTMGGESVPMIAKSVEKTGDMTYLVTIFDYVSDSAGNKITAADVAWSYNTAMAGGKLRPLGDIQSVTATGDYTVEFVFKKAFGPGDLDKILSEAPIVSQKAYEGSPDQFAT